MTPSPAPRIRRAVVLAAALLLVLASSASASTPTFYANASPSTNVGLQVWDHTNLGGTSPTGTLSFKLYAPSDPGCTGAPVFTATTVVSGTGSDDSPRFVTSSAGTYQWTVAYSGDANNSPVATPCPSAGEQVIVNKVYAVASTVAATVGAQIHATTTLSGGFAPLNGTLTFTVTGPNDTFCSGTPVYTRTLPVNGAATYDSGLYTPTAPGTYTYRIRYTGDNDNYGIGPSNCLDQPASTTITQVAPGTPPPATGTPPPATGTPPPATGTTLTPPAGGSKATTPSAPAGGATPTPVPAPATGRPVFGGPASCVRGPFRVYVRGGRVSRVTFYLHGRRLRTVTRADAGRRFTTTVNPRGLPRRTGQQLTAKATTAAGTQILHRVFRVCV